MTDGTKWNTKRAYLPSWLRLKILRRDRYTCQRCGTKAGPFEVDHITAVAFGGTDDESNLQTLCSRCHAPKTQAEKIEGIRRRNERRRLPQKPHPGLKV
ncbi:HNH endonuclease [Corynebacterium kalinowskii]|uniref:HNH endonuclease n=1 Tax=Corynebacterium kalinowskii TaxID=2675216 RepID=UPI0012E1A5E5